MSAVMQCVPYAQRQDTQSNAHHACHTRKAVDLIAWWHNLSAMPSAQVSILVCQCKVCIAYLRFDFFLQDVAGRRHGHLVQKWLGVGTDIWYRSGWEKARTSGTEVAGRRHGHLVQKWLGEGTDIWYRSGWEKARTSGTEVAGRRHGHLVQKWLGEGMDIWYRSDWEKAWTHSAPESGAAQKCQSGGTAKDSF